MANSSNITIRSVVVRPLLYEEIDANFQELIYVIDDYNAHILDTTAHDASSIVFDPSTSELTSITTQDAIVEHVDSSTAHDAVAITYDGTISGLSAVNVKLAIDEIDADLDAHLASTSAHNADDLVFDPISSSLVSTNIQTAIEEVQDNLESHETSLDPHTMYARKDANLSDLIDPDAARETLSAVERTSATGAAALPVGTEAQRDLNPLAGYIRFNSDIGLFEGFNGTGWVPVGAGATGSAGDQVFVENDQVVTANYTIPSDKNALSTGPITISDGVTVTVSDGARWAII